jgi:hypothetical protein
MAALALEPITEDMLVDLPTEKFMAAMHSTAVEVSTADGVNPTMWQESRRLAASTASRFSLLFPRPALYPPPAFLLECRVAQPAAVVK